MRRNLIVCFDGTNNEFGTENTNVVRLVQVLDRDPFLQRVFYDPGVGTLPEPGFVTKVGRKISDILGLAFGAGLSWKVQQAYGYLMDMWEPGDQVYIFGFSRGSYSARVLAGLLHTLGLLPRGNDSLVPYLMRIYAGLTKERQAGANGKGPWQELCDSFRWTFSRAAFAGDEVRRFPVYFLGLWDTVSSVGWVWDPAKYPYTATNPSVATIRHAISLDERRWFFRQNRMYQAAGNVTGQTKGQDLLEYWFPGVHCDVGGGYPEQDGGLWRPPFGWILAEAETAGLKVDAARKQTVLNVVQPSPAPWDDPQHGSLQGAWWIAEYFPKQVWISQDKRLEWQIGGGRSRTVQKGALISKAALDRIRDIDYRPPNLDPAFIQKVLNLPSTPDSLSY